MRPHLPGLALALLALAVFGLGVRPAWEEAAGARVAELRARHARREARAELMRLERSRSRRGPAAAVQSVGPAGARLLRRRVLHVLEGAPVRGVVLEVQAVDPQAPPSVRLAAEGSFADLAALAGRLAAPEAGLALDVVRILQVPNALRLEVTGTAWGGAP